MNAEPRVGTLGLSAAALEATPLLGYRLDGADLGVLVRARQPWIDVFPDSRVAIDVGVFTTRAHDADWLFGASTTVWVKLSAARGLDEIEHRWTVAPDVRELVQATDAAAHMTVVGDVEILVWPGGMVVATGDPRLTLLGLVSENFSHAAYRKYAPAQPDKVRDAVALVPETLRPRYQWDTDGLLLSATNDYAAQQHEIAHQNHVWLKALLSAHKKPRLHH